MKVDHEELIKAAKEAKPENPSFWDQVADFFSREEEKAAQVVKPRETSDY